MKKLGLKNGYVVRIKDGRVGMIVWRRDNDNIGINFGHYHMVVNVLGKDRSKEEQKEWVMALGADDVFTKDEILEIISK